MHLAVIFDLGAQDEIVAQEALAFEVCKEIRGDGALQSDPVVELVLTVELGVPVGVELALIAECFVYDALEPDC